METLGRYRILREIGRGAMGRVYLAHDPEIDRHVAIKTIQIFEALPDAERENARARFLREARAAGKLLHPAIVTVFDVGEAGGIPYLAMEYVEGTTLDAFLDPSRLLSIESAVELVARAAEGLAFAHRAGVVHRDVKPANLMRVGEHAVKIMDFGLAKSAATQLTQDGSLLGTPNYMSPEQVRGFDLDGRSDLFSLGVVLWELLSGEKPFAGDSVSSVLFRIVHEEPRDITPHLGRVPAPLAEFLKRSLAKDPDGRFPDGEAFAKALRDAAGRVAAGAPPPPEVVLPEPDDPVRRERRGSRVAFVVGAGVVLATLGTAGVFLATRSPATPPVPEIEVALRTEPPGLPVRLDGEPVEGSRVRFRGAPPFPTLVVESDCRRVERRLGVEDAGREVVIVPDPTEATVIVDEGVEEGAVVFVNGERRGAAGEAVTLDLCVENRLELRASGHRPAELLVPSGATPLEARTAVGTLRLTPLPKGELVLPDPGYPVRWTVDGAPVRGRAVKVELPEGPHEVRAVAEDHWLDLAGSVEVKGGETVSPPFSLPKLGRLVVQAFPANAKVFLRRGSGEAWRLLDEAPVETSLAPGRYGVRVEFFPSGKAVERSVDVKPGANPPVRVGAADAR